jgi:8-oxo-dGTP diphosphatase
MPPADRPVVAALTQPAQYLITPSAVGNRVAFLRTMERALIDGVRRVQFRIAGLDPAETLALAAEAKRLCDHSAAQLLVNGDIELAAKLGCGVHLKSAQLMALAERPLPTDVPVAASCHDEAQLRQAEAISADFAVLGPVARTPSHDEREPIGWEGFAALREQVSLPIYALGGMRAVDQEKARSHGGQGVAGIRGLWPSAT